MSLNGQEEMKKIHSIAKSGVEWTEVGSKLIEDLLCRCRWKIVTAEARTIEQRLFNIANEMNGNSESDILDEIRYKLGQQPDALVFIMMKMDQFSPMI